LGIVCGHIIGAINPGTGTETIDNMQTVEYIIGFVDPYRVPIAHFEGGSHYQAGIENRPFHIRITPSLVRAASETGRGKINVPAGQGKQPPVSMRTDKPEIPGIPVTVVAGIKPVGIAHVRPIFVIGIDGVDKGLHRGFTTG
jgi:hypothetical protein